MAGWNRAAAAAPSLHSAAVDSDRPAAAPTLQPAAARWNRAAAAAPSLHPGRVGLD
ncbi:MAG: hypothetical protein M3Z97_06210 [Candidatus Dormibacteraeota bacterium]|nr:hypothetical protein [Candidatus Dormibacteraeota bacterium]